MKLYCGPTRAERETRRERRLTQWHRWFAWHPIRFDNTTCVWLEFIQRKGRAHRGYGGHGGLWFEWDYRLSDEE